MSSDVQKYVTPAEDCIQQGSSNISGPFCNATWDTITCWPPTPPGFVVRQLCPLIFGAVEDKYVYKTCQEDGRWATPPLWKGFGYSDYTQCVNHHLSIIEEVFELEKEIAEQTDDPEVPSVNLAKIIAVISLLSVSLISLLVVHLIFKYMLPKGFSYSTSYKITRNVFIIVALEAALCLGEKCLILHDAMAGTSILLGTPVLCKAFIMAFEHANSTIVMWFLIQTHFLQLTSKSGHLGLSGYFIYSLIGWVTPLVPTFTWAIATFLSHRDICWAGYKSQPIVWIMEIPKLIMLITALAYIIMSFQKLSKDYHKLVKRCSYQRLYLQAIGVTLFFTYMCVAFFLTLLLNRLANIQDVSHGFEIVCLVLRSAKGIVLSIAYCFFNSEVRKMLETKIRRVSRQELVPTALEDIET